MHTNDHVCGKVKTQISVHNWCEIVNALAGHCFTICKNRSWKTSWLEIYKILILLKRNSIRVLARSNAFKCKRARQNQKKVNSHINLFLLTFLDRTDSWHQIGTRGQKAVQRTNNEHYINNSNWLYCQFKPIHTRIDLDKNFVKSQLFL